VCDPARLDDVHRELPTSAATCPTCCKFRQAASSRRAVPKAFDRCRREQPIDHAVGATAVGPLPSDSRHERVARGRRAACALQGDGPIKARLVGIENRFLDAVLDVSFAVQAGSTFALVGESRFRKSTLGRAIIGLVPVHAGTVTFEDARPLDRGGGGLAAYRRHVAMMFQDPVASLSPRLTVRSLITEPFVIHGLRDKDRDAEARRLLALRRLPPDFVGRYPHQLSGWTGAARRRRPLPRAFAQADHRGRADGRTGRLRAGRDSSTC